MPTIPLGRYLWERIHQLGVSQIFGVPGDFNLTLLDHVYAVDGLDWFGNTNELNAAYAADGYARVKNGAGCLVTTHGVGELSALNGIAGSMTEQVKVIHVVGQTSRKMQQGRKMIHHSIGFQPDHGVFKRASEGFRIAAAELWNEDEAAEEIDRVLRECFLKSGPVYVFFPMDMVETPVDGTRLEKALNLDPGVDENVLHDVVATVMRELYTAKCPALLVDCLVQRHNAVAEVRELADKLGIQVFSSNLGKGIVDETNPNYVGLYNGKISAPGIESAFAASDLVFMLGDLPADTNTAGFTRRIDSSRAIYVNPHDVSIFGKQFFTVPIKAFLNSLVTKVDRDRVPSSNKPILPALPVEDDHDSRLITQSWLWHYLAANFFQPHDTILGETGTAAFGIPDVTFPPHTKWITQMYYGSIGYATPAALGAEVARLDTQPPERGRTLLVTGDGSLMLTVQEIGNMIKYHLRPVIFVINNAGYTIERAIHGAERSYNDAVPFEYRRMLPFLNMPEEEARESFHRCTTKAELEAVLRLDRVRKPERVQVVEIVMDKLDVPWRLSMQIAARGEQAVKEMKAAGFKVRTLESHEATWE